MARIFISHSSQNNADAMALNNWLSEQGWKDEIFLDLDPKRGIAAGDSWERKLREAADRCEVILFLVSKAWLGSEWCLKELNLANKLNKRPFGILIEDIPIADLPPELSSAWQQVNLASGSDHIQFTVTLPITHQQAYASFSAEGLQRLKIGLDKAGLNAKHFSWPPKNEPDRAPYHGLKAMEESDAGIFFGRDGQIIHAMDKLRGVRDAAPPRMMVILGASGAGKSSFMRAGLLPRLAREDRQFLPLPIIRPEKSVITGETGFLNALETAFQNLGISKSKAEIRECLTNGLDRTSNLLQELVDAASKKSLTNSEEGAKPPTLIISIDQGEELFLTDGAEEADQFLTLLSALMQDDKPAITTLFTIRSDSYDALQTAKQLEGVTQQTISLLPMPKGVYQEVITGPAKRQTEAGKKLEIEDALVQQLLTDIEQGGAKDALPLLAFTLERLYDEYSGEGALKLAGYQALGGIKGAIEAGVKQAFKKADGNTAIPKDLKQREALLRRGLIPWVAGIDPDTGSPRRRVANLRDIPIEARPLIDLLVEQRLLAKDISSKTGEVTIEPAHEALLRQWSLLEGWLEEDFENLSVLEGVKRAALDWASNGEDPEWLSHTGGRLETATKILGERQDLAENLTSDEKTYLDACREKEASEKYEEIARLKREKHRNQIITYGALMASFVMIGVSFILWLNWEEALKLQSNYQRNIVADEILDGNLINAALLSIEAIPKSEALYRGYHRIHYRNLVNIFEEVSETTVFSGHESKVLSAVISSNSQFLATGSYDKTIKIWDIKKTNKKYTFHGHSGLVLSVDFSSDNRFLVSGSSDRTARIWNIETGELSKELLGHKGAVNSVQFSPDGQFIVTSSNDNTARVWNIFGKLIFELKGHVRDVNNASFSPNGKMIATSSSDSTARIWDAKSGELMHVLEGHRYQLNTVAFSPDNKKIVTSSWDKRAIIWDVISGKELSILVGHKNRLHSAYFSPDGKKVVTASSDQTAKIWNVDNGGLYRTLRLHSDSILHSRFSPDSSKVVMSSRDNNISIWEVETGELHRKLAGHSNSVLDVIFTADGQSLISISEDSTARLWDLSGKEIKVQIIKNGLETCAKRGWLYCPSDPGKFLKIAKRIVPRCLNNAERKKVFLLNAFPPRWCITGPDHLTSPFQQWQGKYPYNTLAWKEWLREKDKGNHLPLPGKVKREHDLQQYLANYGILGNLLFRVLNL